MISTFIFHLIFCFSTSLIIYSNISNIPRFVLFWLQLQSFQEQNKAYIKQILYVIWMWKLHFKWSGPSQGCCYIWLHCSLTYFLCRQLIVAAKRKGQILQGICNAIFNFLSFHWLKFCFSYYSLRINSHNNGIFSHFCMEILWNLMSNLSVKTLKPLCSSATAISLFKNH